MVDRLGPKLGIRIIIDDDEIRRLRKRLQQFTCGYRRENDTSPGLKQRSQEIQNLFVILDHGNALAAQRAQKRKRRIIAFRPWHGRAVGQLHSKNGAVADPRAHVDFQIE